MSNVPTNLIPTKITGLPEYLGSSTLGYFPYVLEGRTYKVQFGQLAAVGAVPSTRVIAAGTGLTGGGDLSQDRVISIANGGVGTAQLADSGVIAGSYGSGTDVPVLTVDATGRITAASTTPLSISGYVPTSRTITTGAGLLGGGSLASNLTLTVDFSSATPQALGSATAGVSTAAARGDHVHPAVDLSDTDQTQGALPLGRGGTGDALSPVAGAVVYSTGTKFALADPGLPGQVLTSDGAGEPYWQTITGTGTVTDVSVVTANGFAGTVANPNTTPEITVSTTVTGVVKGNGTALSAAVAGTDYVAPGAITGSGLTMATSRLLGRTTASSGAVEEITVGTGLSLSGGSLVNSAPDQVVTLTGAGTTVVTGTYPNFTITSNDQYTGTVTSVAASGGTTGLSFTGSPITTSGTLTLGGTLNVANGGTGATTAADARTNLGAAASGANSDITSLSGITGAISTVDSITFDTAAGVTVGQGQIAWNAADGTLDIGMGYDAVTQQVGLEQYYRIKASAAITNGQCVSFTGAVGASGVLTGAPAPAIVDGQLIMGVATMDIANNDFGYVTSFGIVRGIDTTGSSVGETWADGDILYHNPAYTGGLTNVMPVAPNPKVVVASVVNAGPGGSGSLFVRVQAEPNLQGLSDVYAPSPISNGQILIGDGPQARWEAATLTAGTNVSITNAAGAITINASDQYTGTVTSVDVSGGTTGLTTSGGPITTSGTITLAGTLNVANGGTGATSLTSGYLIKGNGTSAVSSSIIYDSGTNVGIGIVPSTKLDVAGPIWSRSGGSVGAVAALFADASSGANGITLSASFVTGGYGPIKLDAGGSERMRIDSSGNVGINTSSPGSYKLNVQGTTYSTAYAVSSSEHLIYGVDASTVGIRIGTSGPYYGIGTTGSNNMRINCASGGDMLFAIAGTTYATLQNTTGNFGIGISSPSDKLNVSDGTATFQFKPLGGSSIGYMGMRTNHALGFTTNDTERMQIDSSGNVGVGMTPGVKFDVYGLARFMQTAAPTTGAIVLRSSTSDTYPAYIQWVNNANSVERGFMVIDGSNNFTIQASGSASQFNIGGVGGTHVFAYNESGGEIQLADSTGAGSILIDNSSGLARLLKVGSGNITVGTTSTGFLRFQTADTERARIDGSGNFGIGTSSPSSLLDVNGNAEVNGTLFLGASNHGNLASDTNTLYARGTNIAFQNAAGSGTYAYIDSSGNLLVGSTSAPSGNGTNLQVANSGAARLWLTSTGFRNFYLESSSGNALQFVDGTAGAERMRIGSNGGVAIGGTGTDASLHIQQAYGGYNRLTQMAPSGTSNNAFNLMAAKNSGGSDNWWSWGVRTDAVWCLVPGVDSALTSSTGIYFDSSAQAYKPGGGSWQATSDARVKTNIAPITDAASRIMALKPSSFDYRAPEAHAGRTSDRGFIAQEFEEVYPHSVSSIGLMCDEEKVFFAEGEEMKTLGLNNDFFADLVALVQEQQETINNLRARVAQLEGN